MLYDIDGNNSTEVNYSSSGGTWEGNSFGSSGAAYSFVDPNGGNDVVYATDNDGSGLYRLQYESGTFTVSRVSTAAGASSKNDGAGCADEEDPHDPDSGSSGPSDISSTVSQSLGTCSGGSATSTLSITNNSSATGYYYVQYKIDSGSYQNADTNLTVGAGVTNTSLSASVSNGSTITWRYKDSNVSGSFGSASYTTLSASSTVDCTVGISVSQSLGSCSSDSKTSTLTITNNESYTAYLVVEYSLNGGTSYSPHTSGEDADNFSLAAGATDNSTFTKAVQHGQTIIWRVSASPTTSNTGASQTSTSESSTVSCKVIDTSVGQALGDCTDAGAKVSTFTMQNSGSANSPAFFNVQYKIDSGSYQNASNTNVEVAAGGSATLTATVPHGSTITWQYRTSTTDGSYTGRYTPITASDSVNCPVIDTSVSGNLGSCASGEATYTFTMNNSNSATTAAYFEVQ